MVVLPGVLPVPTAACLAPEDPAGVEGKPGVSERARGGRLLFCEELDAGPAEGGLDEAGGMGVLAGLSQTFLAPDRAGPGESGGLIAPVGLVTAPCICKFELDLTL